MLAQPIIRQNLFVATQSRVHLHTLSDRSKYLLFECKTQTNKNGACNVGILNAQPAHRDIGIFAVADEHVVLLCNVDSASGRLYRFKSGEDQPRLLGFGSDGKVVYFGTTLSNSIEAYSLETGDLLPSLYGHPSPPTVLAISKTCDVLISASATPPIVYIHDLRTPRSMPIRFFPSHMKASVTSAAFKSGADYSSSPTIQFVLGYQDGALELYTLPVPHIPDPDTSNVQSMPALLYRQPMVVAIARKLHKAAMGRTRAVDFIPGYKSRVISVGRDGKCRIVDFHDGCKILRTWRVEGQPTCLSVLAAEPLYASDGSSEHSPGYYTPAQYAMDLANAEPLIAIGTSEGRIYVYNILGLVIHELTIDGPAVSLSWVGDMLGTANSASHRTSLRSRSANTSASEFLPILNTILQDNPRNEEVGENDQETGTVCRTDSPGKLARLSIVPPLDLFSSPASEFKSSSLSTSQREKRKRSRKSCSRPRIVTDTFQMPVGATALSLPLETSVQPLNLSEVSDVRRSSRIHTPIEAWSMSPALPSRQLFENSQMRDDDHMTCKRSEQKSEDLALRHAHDGMSVHHDEVAWTHKDDEGGLTFRESMPSRSLANTPMEVQHHSSSVAQIGRMFSKRRHSASSHRPSPLSGLDGGRDSLLSSLATPLRRRGSSSAKPAALSNTKGVRAECDIDTHTRMDARGPVRRVPDNPFSAPGYTALLRNTSTAVDEKAFQCAPVLPHDTHEQFREIQGAYTDWLKSATGDRESWRRENAELRTEMQCLRDEFRMLRSAILRIGKVDC